MKVTFDGDELNLELLIDRQEHDDFWPFAPHYNVPDHKAPFTISKNVGLTDPTVATMASWMHNDNPFDPSRKEKSE